MIDRAQSQLEAIYEIQSELRAEAFLVDEAAAKALGYTGRAREELLVAQTEEGLELALYLDPELLRQLRALEQKPADALLDGPLGSYLELFEGVSHFVYLTHTANLGRTVSLLELEAQAEIDKFASCILYGWRRGIAWARDLLVRLFDRVSFREGLSLDERWRYGEANRLAKNYCQRLLRHIDDGRMDRLLGALRYSYRLGAEAKLQHLAKTA